MERSGNTLRNIFVWTYERGTLAYDILCALILAFVFLVPTRCFAPKNVENREVDQNLKTTSPSKTANTAPHYTSQQGK